MKPNYRNATSVSVAGFAILIEGAPKTGKSSLALSLIDLGAKLISDDLTFLKKEGDIDSYAMIGSFPVLKYAIIANGPCIGGLPVRCSYSNDFWNGDSLEGGHAISIVGYKKDKLIIRNSWGNSFGCNGYWYLPESDFSKFFEIWTIM
jgi:hypothetical protein